MFDADECIPQGKCGCVYEGLLHGLHEEFWGDSTCTKRCVCDAESRRAVCRSAGCRAEEECRVEDGVQGCYPKRYGTCAATGATHYESFDGGKFIFQGTCMYQFAGLCQKNQGLVDFQVLVQNGRQDKELLASVALVMVKVYGKTIVISQEHPGKIMVSLANVSLPNLHVLHFLLLIPTSLSHFFFSTLAPLFFWSVLGNAEYFSPTTPPRSRATRSVSPTLIKMRFNHLNRRIST